METRDLRTSETADFEEGGGNEAVNLCRQLSNLPEDTSARLACVTFVVENLCVFHTPRAVGCCLFPFLLYFSSCAATRYSTAFLFIMQTCTQPPRLPFFIHHVHEPRNPSTVDDALSICSCRAGAGAGALAGARTHTHTLALTHSQCVVSGAAGGCISPDGSIRPHAASCYTICIV